MLQLSKTLALVTASLALVVLSAEGCGSSNTGTTSGGTAPDGGSPEQTGQSCKAATDCYPGLDGGTLKGAAQCLTQVPNGYCTHACQTDADCCAVPGECRTSLKQVCSPFESTGQMLCFLSCDDSVLPAADAGADAATVDPNVFCQSNANATFTCRSTGGGSKNRKVCLP